MGREMTGQERKTKKGCLHSRTSATTRSTCRTETSAQRRHQGRWLFKVPAELRHLPEVHAGQKQMRQDSTKEGGSSRSQQNFGDYQKYMQDRNKCATQRQHQGRWFFKVPADFGDYQKYMQDRNKCEKTAPRNVALQGPSRTSATTRSTCRTETNAQRQHQGRWLFKVPVELRRLPEGYAGQKQMRKDSTKEGGSSRSQQNFGDYQKYMQDRNKCEKTAPRKVALQGPSRTSATTRSTCRTETNAQRQHQGRWLFKENFGKCLKFWTDSCAFAQGAEK